MHASTKAAGSGTPEFSRSSESIHIPLEKNLSLVHEPRSGEGKTASMAKGLFLCHRGTILSGGSTGFGLPLLHSCGSTRFPSLESVEHSDRKMVKKVFRMNRVVQWRFRGHRCPPISARLGEILAAIYMGMPPLQNALLRLRDTVLRHLGVEPSMEISSGDVRCTVEYRTRGPVLLLRVLGDLPGKGDRLTVMNEASGAVFTHLRSKGRLRDRSLIRGWEKISPYARFEAPREGIGFSLHLNDVRFPATWNLMGGREVAGGLNWAGLALSVPEPCFSYGIHFQRLNSEGVPL